MTDLETPNTPSKTFSRRTVIKTAAWSVPVIAATAAIPGAAASVNNASVQWGSDTGALLSLSLFDGTALANAALLASGPNNFSIINGVGEIPGPLTFTITSVYSSGLSLGLTRPKGVGVRNIPGATRTSWSETAPAGDLPLLQRPFTVTSTFSYSGSIASLATALQNVEYSYTDAGSALLGLNLLGSFSLSLTVLQEGTLIGADTATLSVPLSANVLG